jgi:hypothetical protein
VTHCSNNPLIQDFPISNSVYACSVSNPTISGANSWAICRTSATDRVARGLGITTIRAPGIPSVEVRAWAARVKELVMTLREGTPFVSVITVSWRPHVVQDPQSATPWITTSHSWDSVSSVSVAQGAL